MVGSEEVEVDHQEALEVVPLVEVVDSEGVGEVGLDLGVDLLEGDEEDSRVEGIRAMAIVQVAAAGADLVDPQEAISEGDEAALVVVEGDSGKSALRNTFSSCTDKISGGGYGGPPPGNGFQGPPGGGGFGGGGGGGGGGYKRDFDAPPPGGGAGGFGGGGGYEDRDSKRPRY